MDTRNVFNLMGEFSHSEEDQLTASLGALLGNDYKLLKTFLQRIGVRISNRDAASVKIETQVWEGESRLDLKLSLPNQFVVYVESKLTLAATKQQLAKYMTRLLLEKSSSKKFVLLSIYPEDKNLYSASKSSTFKRSNAINLLWKDILKDLMISDRLPDREFIFQQFIERWKRTMEGEINPSELKVGELEEALVVVVRPASLEYIRKHGIYVPPAGKKWHPSQFVAFYISKPFKELRYLGKVRRILYDVPRKKLPEGYYPKKGQAWPQVIEVEKPLIELMNKLKGTRKIGIWGGKYTTLAKLLSAKSKTMDDLLI